MKDSKLEFNIIDGEFDDQFFPADRFEPMIEILINENHLGTNSEQAEHTKVVKRPNNMNPEWKEVFTFDICKDTDEVAIYIINNFEGSREILAEKRFVLNKIGEEYDDPLHELATQ